MSKAKVIPLTPPELKTGIFTITPTYAATLLERNEGNRPISQPLVDELAHAMSTGTWKLNGETVKIATSGRVLDGQHRLHACVQSQQDFTTILINGVDDSTFDTIDVGKRRSHGDVLHLAGFKTGLVLAASIRWSEAIRLNALGQGRAGVAMSPQEVLAFAQTHPRFVEILYSVESHAKAVGRFCSRTHLAPVLYFADKANPERAAEFLSLFISGEGLYKNHPILTLRDALLDLRANSDTRPLGEEIIARIIRAWNAFARGDTLSPQMMRGSVRQPNGFRIFPQMETPQ